MPINPELLELSIKECYSQFLDYLQLIRYFINSSLSFGREQLEGEEIEKIEARANSYFCKHLLNLEGQCAKNTPSHTKLRFFLALLLSLKDLERCCDYLYSISKLAKEDGEKRLREIILNSELGNLIALSFQDIYALFKNSRGKIEQNIFQKALQKKFQLQSKLSELSVKLNHRLLSQWRLKKEPLDNYDEVSQLELVRDLLSLSRALQLTLVKTDRFLDHVFNIVENFYYIKNQELNLSQDARINYTLSLLNEKYHQDS